MAMCIGGVLHSASHSLHFSSLTHSRWKQWMHVAVPNGRERGPRPLNPASFPHPVQDFSLLSEDSWMLIGVPCMSSTRTFDWMGPFYQINSPALARNPFGFISVRHFKGIHFSTQISHAFVSFKGSTETIEERVESALFSIKLVIWRLTALICTFCSFHSCEYSRNQMQVYWKKLYLYVHSSQMLHNSINYIDWHAKFLHDITSSTIKWTCIFPNEKSIIH